MLITAIPLQYLLLSGLSDSSWSVKSPSNYVSGFEWIERLEACFFLIHWSPNCSYPPNDVDNCNALPTSRLQFRPDSSYRTLTVREIYHQSLTSWIWTVLCLDPGFVPSCPISSSTHFHLSPIGCGYPLLHGDNHKGIMRMECQAGQTGEEAVQRKWRSFGDSWIVAVIPGYPPSSSKFRPFSARIDPHISSKWGVESNFRCC